MSTTAEQMERLREESASTLDCAVVGPEDLAGWFASIVADLDLVRVRQIHLTAAGSGEDPEWARLRERAPAAGGVSPDGVRIRGPQDGAPSVEMPCPVVFDLLDTLTPPAPSADGLVVGKAGCQLLAYLSTGPGRADGPAPGTTAPLAQLFSFLGQVREREGRLSARLTELDRAYRDVERRLAETFFTHEFFKALTVYEPLRTVAPMIVDGALGIMGAESCALYVRREHEAPELRLLAAQGRDMERWDPSIRADCAWVDDRFRDERGRFEVLASDGVASELLGRRGIVGVLSRKDDLLGLLMVVSEDLEYTDLELERFRSVSGMAALSLQNVLLHEEVEKQSITDQLTGLFNHRYFQQALSQEFLRAKSDGTELCLIMIDLDFFKELNDNHGHLFGDMFLRRVGAAIRASVGEGAIPSRYGGDEFAVILPGISLEAARTTAEQIFERVRGIQIEVPDGVIEQRTVSAGAARLDGVDSTPSDLFDRADQALYVAKENGRSQVRVYDPSAG